METRILDYIKRDLLADESFDLKADDDLLGSGLISSMAIFRLITFLEETFHVRIPPEEMVIEHFITVNAMAAYVRDRQTAAA